jgi:hypothetical protein
MDSRTKLMCAASCFAVKNAMTWNAAVVSWSRIVREEHESAAAIDALKARVIALGIVDVLVPVTNE